MHVANRTPTAHSSSPFVRIFLLLDAFYRLTPRRDAETQRYASSLCGQSVTVTNLNNGRVATATIADQCPGCANANSLDLSIGSWEAIGESTADGSEVPISWVLNN